MSVIDGNSVILTPAHIQVVIGKDRSCTTMADPATIVLKKTVPADLAKVRTRNSMHLEREFVIFAVIVGGGGWDMHSSHLNPLA